MKKIILFKIDSLNIGGIERLAVDVLKNIDYSNKKIYLLVERHREEILGKELPKEKMEIIYLKSKKLEEFIEYVKSRKKNIFFKLIYNFLMSYERIVASRTINKISKKYDNKVTFIDYAGSSTKYIRMVKSEKKIYWSHFTISNIKKSKLKRLGKRLDKYDTIVTICDEMKEEYENLFPKLKNKIKRIYNFIDEKKIEQKITEGGYTLSDEEYKLLKDEYCLSVGRLTNQKDHKTMIEAFSILKSKGIKEKLYILGDGELRTELEQIIKEKKLENEIILLGSKANPYIWMKSAKLFIHSAIFEGFGLVITEAMYLEIPIIISNFKAGSFELIEKEKNGEVFEIGNCNEFAEKIEKLLKNDELKKEYISKSKKLVEKFYLENIIKEYEKIMNE